MPELEQKTFQKRQVAHKIDVSTILKCPFARDELSAGFLKVGNLKISRVNLIGTIVYISDQNGAAVASVDDGSGRINLRTFGQQNVFSKIDVGDLTLIIGKVREFNNEKYIIPEIVKKLDDSRWVTLRKLELTNLDFSQNEVLETKEPAVADSTDVYSLIKSLDLGDGVFIEDIVSKSKNQNAEKIINKLLENGDIFEILPGKLKVLE